MNTIGHCPRFLTYRNIEKKELQNWKRITERRYYFPSASNNLSASMLRIKKKGAFQKRLSFKYSQSLKSETRLITVAKYCIHWHFLSNTFLLHQPFTPKKKKVFKTWTKKKSLRRELKVLTDCLCVDEWCFWYACNYCQRQNPALVILSEEGIESAGLWSVWDSSEIRGAVCLPLEAA